MATHTSVAALVACLLAPGATLAGIGVEPAAIAGPAHERTVEVAQATGERVPVRSGVHEGYARLVFDWASNIDYRASKNGNQVVVTFARSAAIDLDAVKRRPPAGVTAVEQAAEGTGVRVTFTVSPDSRLRHFKSGTKVVVDLLSADSTVADSKPAEKPAPEKPQAERPAERASTPTPTASASTAPAERPRAAAATSAPTSIVPAVLDKPAEKPAAPATSAARPAKPETPPATATAPATRRAETTTVAFSGTAERPRILFSFKEPPPVAVFQRAGFLWVVLDESAPLQIAATPEAIGPAIPLVERIALDRAVAIRFRVRDGLFAAVTAGADGWGIDLLGRPTPARTVAPVTREADAAGGRVLVAADEPGSRLTVKDPEVGDTLYVVPLKGGVGVPVEREFLQFKVLQTAQGVVVSPTADEVSVRTVRNGVEVSVKGGLLLSTAAAAPATENGEAATKPAERPAPVALQGPVFTYDKWVVPGAPTDALAQRALINDIIETPPQLRSEKRWRLAKYLFGRGLHTDALGVMQLIAADDPLFLENPEFRAIRGAALALIGRFEDALTDLSGTALDGDKGVRLFRAYAKAKLKNWPEALADFTLGADAFVLFPPGEQAKLRLAAATAAFETAEFGRIPKYLEPILKDPPSVFAQAHAELLLARAKAELNDTDGALEGFAKVIELDDRLARTEARFAKVNLELKLGKIETDKAIATLDGMRHAWRGDDLEYRILQRVATMYVEAKQYREGLTAYREIALGFPDSPWSKAVIQDMESLFRSLYLEGQADDLAPYNAIALYYDFRELTPAGPEGDTMIRKLADRMASVELFDRAAQLLDHQVRFRLAGEDKARVGAKLAAMYLLDRKPQDAIRILRISRWTRPLPELNAERDLLEARALLDLDRAEEALKLIEKDQSRNAELIRAEVYWRAGNWQKIAQSTEQLLGERWKDERPLDQVEEVQVLRIAVALTLLDSRVGLDSLKRRYGPKMAMRAKAFELLTADFERKATPFKELAKEVASLSKVDAFLASYYEAAKKSGGAKADNQPKS